VRRVQLRDHKDQVGNRYRGDDQTGDHGRIGGEEVEVDENSVELENQPDQQRRRCASLAEPMVNQEKATDGLQLLIALFVCAYEQRNRDCKV
jgi:hypothetical protein